MCMRVGVSEAPDWSLAACHDRHNSEEGEEEEVEWMWVGRGLGIGRVQ